MFFTYFINLAWKVQNQLLLRTLVIGFLRLMVIRCLTLLNFAGLLEVYTISPLHVQTLPMVFVNLCDVLVPVICRPLNSFLILTS